eukprot:1161499-Pelagomonas_calceolata.AAC.6
MHANQEGQKHQQASKKKKYIGRRNSPYNKKGRKGKEEPKQAGGIILSSINGPCCLKKAVSSLHHKAKEQKGLNRAWGQKSEHYNGKCQFFVVVRCQCGNKPCAEFRSVNCSKESHAQSLHMKQACKVIRTNSIRLQCQTLGKYTVLPHDAQKIRERHHSKLDNPCPLFTIQEVMLTNI